MIKKQSSKLDGLKALGRPGISRQLEPESLTGGVESRRHAGLVHAGKARKAPRSSTVLLEQPVQVDGVGVASSPVKVVADLQGPVHKRGRPRLGESHLTLAHTKPWSVAGM